MPESDAVIRMSEATVTLTIVLNCADYRGLKDGLMKLREDESLPANITDVASDLALVMSKGPVGW